MQNRQSTSDPESGNIRCLGYDRHLHEEVHVDAVDDVHVLGIGFGSKLRTSSLDSGTHEYLSRIKLQIERVIHQSFQLMIIFFCILSVPLFVNLLH